MLINQEHMKLRRIYKIQDAFARARELALAAGYSEIDAEYLAYDARENASDCPLWTQARIIVATAEMMIDQKWMPESV